MAHADVQKPGQASVSLDEMVRLPGGMFRMGSDHHYPKEAPSHRVTVDGFWIDKTPVRTGSSNSL
jgi:formylglycine-generating enzyme required for sulfatase activity